jgi:hypothetical protein
MVGTAWLAPKNRYPTHHSYWAGGAQPGPPGPAGYYPPVQTQDAYGNYYTPPPYTPNAQFTGTTTPDAYYAPPAGPPPGHAGAYEMETQHGRNGNVSVTGSPAPPVPVSTHPTGETTHSYVQSNNPFQPPATPPPARITDIHGNTLPRKE